MSTSNSNMSETDDKQNVNRKKPKSSTERSRKYRNRLKAARLQEELEKRLQATVSSLILEEAGDSPTPPSETSESVKDLNSSKTSTERVRKYRARKRAGISARALPQTKRPKTGAERVWEYRERKKAARLREEEECFKATVRSLLLEEDANHPPPPAEEEKWENAINAATTTPNKPTNNDMEAGDSPTPRSEVSESVKRPKTSTELVWKYRARMKAARLREEEECFKATVRSLLLKEAANPSPPRPMTMTAATTTPNKPTKNYMDDKQRAKSSTERSRERRKRQKAAFLQQHSSMFEEAVDSTPSWPEVRENVNELNRPKTGAERARDYRARKKTRISKSTSPEGYNFKRPKTTAERVRKYRERKRAARLQEEEERRKSTVACLLLEEAVNLPPPLGEASESVYTLKDLEEESTLTLSAATQIPNKPARKDMVEQWKLKNVRDAYRAKMQRMGYRKEYLETSATYDSPTDIQSNVHKIKVEGKDEDSNGSHDIDQPPDIYSMCEIKLEPYQFSDEVVNAARESIEAPSSTTSPIATLEKSFNRVDNQVQFLETLQREGQSLMQLTQMDVRPESSTSRVDDSDYTFLLSFLPHMKRMSELQNLQFRAKMSDLLLNTLNPPQTSVVPVQANQQPRSLPAKKKKILQKLLTQQSEGDSISYLI